MTTELQLTTKQISVFSEEYKQRRKQQMMRFFGATVFTLISARLAFRGVQSRKYVPHMFQLNNKPPLYSFQGEAVSALAFGTGLSTGSFGMLVFGSCWLADISSLAEFTIKVRKLMGDPSSAYDMADQPIDPETQKVAKALEDLLESAKR